MAAAGGSLYCVTADELLWRRDPVLSDVNWQQTGAAPQVHALAATTEGLYGATSSNRLLKRDLP